MIFAKWVAEDNRFTFSETDNGGIKITDEYHAELFAEHDRGRSIVPDANGYPANTVPTLQQLKSEKTEEIKVLVTNTITAGIDCDVLGEMHHYPTGANDQANMNGLISKALLEGESGSPYKFWCNDSNGVWARRSHTAAQIKSVGLAVATHVIAAQDKYESKLDAINAASTQAELDAITW